MTEDARILFTKPLVMDAQDTDQVALDAFGMLLMKLVRDHTIENMNGNIIAGRIGKRKEDEFVDITSIFTGEQLALVLQVIAETVDATLHHLLWTLDRVEWIDVLVNTSSGTIPSIKKVSDGLYGELYRWIPEFSEQPHEPTV